MALLMNLPDPDRTRLSSSPLELVVCQVRHERRLAVGEGATAMAVYDALGGAEGRYPNLDEVTGAEFNVVMGVGAVSPNVSENKTSGWRFATEDGTWAVTLMPDHFALETTAYTTWDDDFAPRLSDLIDAVAEHLNPTFERRIGLRYIDRITELELPDVASWREYLRPEVVGLIAHPDLGDLVRAAQQQLVIEIGNSVFAGLRHGPVNAPEGIVDYQLDYDVFRQGGRPFDPDTLKATISEFNTYALQLFHATVTEQLLEALR